MLVEKEAQQGKSSIENVEITTKTPDPTWEMMSGTRKVAVQECRQVRGRANGGKGRLRLRKIIFCKTGKLGWGEKNFDRLGIGRHFGDKYYRQK